MPSSSRVTCSGVTLMSLRPVCQTFADLRLVIQQKDTAVLKELNLCFKLNTELHSDSEKKSQIESLKQEISSLKEQIIQQQQELHTKTVQVRKPGCKTLNNHFAII